ncbi:MAG: hypothetical protein A2Y97_01755 [Nitrospirae bacterium RBG_13_39_12]|nr:MAG: hypothetical protein A2Y97_01755 [Nitrospirae bacterium RBG_13_39_12]
MATKATVVSIKGESPKDLEGQAARRVMRRLFFHGEGERRDIIEVDGDKPLTVKDLRSRRKYDVYILINGIVYITLEGVNNLIEIISRKKAFPMVGPVSNESTVAHQRYSPPFFYQTISVFRWAEAEIRREFRDKVAEVDEIDDFCFAFRRELLDGLPDDYKVIDLPKILKKRGLRYGIAKGVYVHRYGNCYESGREDLMAYVPLGAREILDIGSARGLFGEMLKKRQRCVVTGVDIDTQLITVARKRVDNVIHGDIEEISGKAILGKYDCIVCGDVLEHLNNPWEVVRRLKNHLRKGGLFIASTPNIANWAIIYEMLQERWDYVPFSILSGTHVRFFTKKTLEELFEDTGYKIKEVKLQSFGIPPRGAEFVAGLKHSLPGISEEDLKASEIVIVAEA